MKLSQSAPDLFSRKSSLMALNCAPFDNRLKENDFVIFRLHLFILKQFNPLKSMSLFFADNSNRNFDHGKINTTGRSICADKGFSCPALYSPMQLFSHFTTVADFIIIPLLVYLSFAKVKDSLFKYFTLNLMAVLMAISIVDLVADALDIAVLFIDEKTENLYEIGRWARRILNSGNIWFHSLALYATVICYLPYAHPIFYAKHFVNKSQKLHYVVLHMSLFLWISFMHFIRQKFSIIAQFHITHLALFIALFVLAIMASVEIYKYKPAGVDAIHVGKLRRKRLLSFVIYSYANEIVILPRFLASLALVICSCIRCQIKESVFYDKMATIIQIFYESNSIAIGLSTIVALEPYRHAVLSMFRKQN
uniref:G-protein coupled receptors family 1 profile domain-containing protein n=1 Tax=Onchocerca volvulus TaxID=6282 RepID=A0A2K6WDY2_ONCVO